MKQCRQETRVEVYYQCGKLCISLMGLGAHQRFCHMSDVQEMKNLLSKEEGNLSKDIDETSTEPELTYLVNLLTPMFPLWEQVFKK